MPSRGVDPHFGCSRSMYYQLNKSGEVPFTRIRRPGNQRGIVLISFERMSKYVRKFDGASSAARAAASS